MAPAAVPCRISVAASSHSPRPRPKRSTGAGPSLRHVCPPPPLPQTVLPGPGSTRAPGLIPRPTRALDPVDSTPTATLCHPLHAPPPRRAAGGAGPSTCPYWLAYSPYPMPPARPLGPTPLLQLAHALAAPAAVPPTDRLILANKFSPRHFAIHGLHHDTPTHLSYLRPSFGPGPARSSPHVACAASTVLAPTRAHATLAPYPCLRATHWHPQAFPQTLPARP